jgi:NADH:ubiquinone oxidoreductase subunit E
MLEIAVCVGSSCYVRGAEAFASDLERLIKEHEMAAKVELVGAYCMEQCSMGVSVRVRGRLYRAVSPKDAERFFEEEICPLLTTQANS